MHRPTHALPRRHTSDRAGVSSDGGAVKAVLGPTNTGKTHLAIERLCAHSSGAIGFPLRLLAREVYDRVVAIKGPNQVALITGEERIEPKDARWLLCTAEAMPTHADLAFVALDEAQIGADPERGHVFTDRLLHARGREETMLLGSAMLEPLVRKLVPEAEIISRPRFSTLTHVGAKKLSRIPPRSAIVAFSAEQVYAIAEMLRRFRGGAAVVMGALSPQTRNAQVALYQSGEVDYLVATDAIGMGLNLDIHHIAFAGLSKFDGHRQRRLTPAEMAQIAGRAGRHQRDGTFGTLAGNGSNAEFTPEEIYAIEEHRFPPLTRLFWREAEPRFDSVATLIADLESPPPRLELAPAPEAIDLAVLKRLCEEPEIAPTLRGSGTIARFWSACQLPDFRQQGAETHGRFIARLWQDLRNGTLGADYIAQAIAQLDNPSGDIDTLQGRIAAIRSWAYIAQRPDWVMAREEMAARARAVEARLSDAIHARLTERFVNRRTSVLMRKTGADAALLPVEIDDAGAVTVDGEPLGHLEGFRFEVDASARASDRKLLLAAADRHLPSLIAARATALVASAAADDPILQWRGAAILWRGHPVARLELGRTLLSPRVRLEAAVGRLDPPLRIAVQIALDGWSERGRRRPLAALIRLDEASRDPASGPELRALLLHLIDGGGTIVRVDVGLDRLEPALRERLRRLDVRIGALDVFVPGALRPAAMAWWSRLASVKGISHRPPPTVMPSTIDARDSCAGYRRVGAQALRVDLAERLLHAAHRTRAAGGKLFVLEPATARSMGLTGASYAALLRAGGFRVTMPRRLSETEHGPTAPPLWHWRRPRAEPVAARIASPPPRHAAFAALADLVR
ncbi:helicase-related protein [Novosphingobium sp.]|uniref:helicase-related protein n=1 Tax=Novosphingobium sp. TaxID=1874826 RepID=UPI0025F575D8|nr:helicase-related protein [Novosphingobium sp.]